MNGRLLAGIVVAVLALAAPWVAYPVFLMTALCFALFAGAFNLLLGYAGLMSFGHAMFFGMAAYFYGHVVKEWNWPMEFGLVAGVLGAAALGLVVRRLHPAARDLGPARQPLGNAPDAPGLLHCGLAVGDDRLTRLGGLLHCPARRLERDAATPAIASTSCDPRT